MNNKEDSSLNNAIEAMNKAVSNKTKEERIQEDIKINQGLIAGKEISYSNKGIEEKLLTPGEVFKPEEALIEPYSRKHKTGVKLFNEELREKVLKLAEDHFFYDAICAKAGIYRQRLSEELSRNEAFGQAFTHARSCWLAEKQRVLEEYAKNKSTSDWRALKYLLTIADKEYSERKYLTDAVTNQDAKILMQINAEKLVIAGEKGQKMLEGVNLEGFKGVEDISLKPFKPVKGKKKPKPKTVGNKGENDPTPPSQ